MGAMKTPGVYIVEKNAFPNSVVEVATAVPAFIGYTAAADEKGTSLYNRPKRITSMAQYHDYFGEGPAPRFSIKEKDASSDPALEPAFTIKDPSDPAKKKEYLLLQEEGRHLLYYSMLLFFQNGGGPCYVVSVGSYGDEISADKLTDGVDLLIKEQEPTMVVIPETVLLSEGDSISVQQAVLKHCGSTMKNRFGILDIWDKYDGWDSMGESVANFRNALGVNQLNYGAAYYPWVNTTIVQDNQLSWQNFGDKKPLLDLVTAELGLGKAPPPKKGDGPQAGEGGTPPKPAPASAGGAKKEKGPGNDPQEAKKQQQAAELHKLTTDPGKWEGVTDPGDPQEINTHKELLDTSLRAMSPLYVNIISAMRKQLNLLPPGAGMAGLYTMVDNLRGVWKAPANVSMNSVVSPAVDITHDEQEDLNVTPQGKSVNAIRKFIGEGVLVWGARTLDGNSLDWRYINVRRTMIMLEESIKLASKAYVFEANDANTWVTMKSMIRNFLTGIWKRGGLAGASPEDAFSVHVGLGETMTPEDILEGILRITVLVAVTRPAEFIEITFQQQMQKS